VYFIRFGSQLSEFARIVTEFLLHLSQSSPDDCLIPLGLLTRSCPLETQPYYESIWQMTLFGLKDVRNSSACYSAAMCVSFLADVPGLISDVGSLLDLLMGVLSEENQPLASRRAALNAICDMAGSSADEFRLRVPTLMVLIETIFPMLELLYGDDELETSLMVTAIGNCILEAMKSYGIKEGEQFLSSAKEWLMFVVSKEEMMERLGKCALALLQYMSTVYKNGVLEMIEDEGEIGEFIVNQADSEIVGEQANQILVLLGYEA
jgi:hypothetical protein